MYCARKSKITTEIDVLIMMKAEAGKEKKEEKWQIKIDTKITQTKK